MITSNGVLKSFRRTTKLILATFFIEDITEEIDETSAQISNSIEHFLLTKSSPSNYPSEVRPQESTSSQAPSTTGNTNEKTISVRPNDIIPEP